MQIPVNVAPNDAQAVSPAVMLGTRLGKTFKNVLGIGYTPENQQFAPEKRPKLPQKETTRNYKHPFFFVLLLLVSGRVSLNIPSGG